MQKVQRDQALQENREGTMVSSSGCIRHAFCHMEKAEQEREKIYDVVLRCATT